MLDLVWRLHDADGVTFVATVVENAAPTPRRVRIESRLDASVQPPRRRGLPERGWDEDGYEGTVPAEGRLAVGFASLADPAEPPVEIVLDERADTGVADRMKRTDPEVTTRTTLARVENPSPTDVLRELGSPAPPRDAVPDSEPMASAVSDRTAFRGSSDLTAPRETLGTGPEESDETRRDRPVWVSEEVPDSVAIWFADVVARIERVEGLVEARELTAAADAIAATGGLDGVEDLLATLAADRATLQAVARDAEALAARCDVVEAVPLDAYRRLS